MLRFLLGYFFVVQICCDKKIWKYDNDVTNPKNWADSLAGTCDGYIFPDVLGSIGSINQMKAAEILLPITGELEIQGHIEFSSLGKCVHVKELASRRWLDPRNWQYPENAARPDAEKVPCVNDDVIFPSEDVGVLYPEVPVSVKSVQIKDFRLTDFQWQNFLVSDYGVDQFQDQNAQGRVRIESNGCGDCTCHNRLEETLPWICNDLPKSPAPCFEPLKPVGFCNEICGGVVYLNITPRFSLELLQQRLPKDVDVFASKILLEQKPLVQVIFAEKSQYTEKSAKVARDFYKTVSSDLSSFRVKSVSVKTSGISLPLGSAPNTVVGIILGTLLSVALVFVCLYVIYMGPLQHHNFTAKIPLPRYLFNEQRQYIFNKLDNKEMSRATSMVSLEKSFDNPMYGSEPSTSTGKTVSS
ncbi:hypothetical protein RN001_011180 [Aquatica leii]|uniref:Protein amnionless n=1 Tax=Aquatica leii TaxID=1421715 RepID=A0AAN7PVP9_9COLE|nr:hypothetical protein RN001_011180 [Aquatica leii]